MSDASTSTTAIQASRAVLRSLHDARGFVFDVDGTLVLGDDRNHGPRPLPGALALTRWLDSKAIPYVLYTNGTARPPEVYAHALRDAGFAIDNRQLLTPASTAAELFLKHGYRRVLALGGQGVSAPLRAGGIEIVEPLGKPTVDAVLIGWFREFTMDHLEAACHAVWHGAQVYSASQALFFATASGRSLGTSRAIAAMIRDLTGCRIHVVGKPSLAALGSAARQLGVRTRELAVVGDDPSLEVPMAHRGGALAIAVRTGLGNATAFAGVPRNRRPHLSIAGVDELLTLLSALH